MSFLTAPVLASTFSMPKIFWRAAIIGSAAIALQDTAMAPAVASARIRLVASWHPPLKVSLGHVLVGANAYCSDADVHCLEWSYVASRSTTPILLEHRRRLRNIIIRLLPLHIHSLLFVSGACNCLRRTPRLRSRQ